MSLHSSLEIDDFVSPLAIVEEKFFCGQFSLLSVLFLLVDGRVEGVGLYLGAYLLTPRIPQSLLQFVFLLESSPVETFAEIGPITIRRRLLERCLTLS